MATAVISAGAGCASSFTHQLPTPASAPTQVTTSPVPQAHSACNDLSGTVEPDQTCHVQTLTPAYQIDVSFPLDYPDLQSVTDFLKRDRAEFIDWVAKFGPTDGRGRPYELVTTAKNFRSGTPESGTLSLVLEIDNDTGLAHEGHPDTTFAAFNYDLGQHSPITFDTLFKPGTRPLEVLNPIVQSTLNAPSADLDEKTYQNFAITDEAVIFFFGQDQVVPDNNGPHHVVVPRTELGSLIR
jgi:uncharacterized protein DUF3298